MVEGPLPCLRGWRDCLPPVGASVRRVCTRVGLPPSGIHGWGPLTLFARMAGLSAPSRSLSPARVYSGRPATFRYSWLRVWSDDIWASTERTTGSTHGRPSSVRYAETPHTLNRRITEATLDGFTLKKNHAYYVFFNYNLYSYQVQFLLACLICR